MAFVSRFRRFITGPSSLSSQFASVRLNSTLTSPKLFISGLSGETTDDQLTEAFNPFGQIVEAKVIRDRATGRSKGFGFVTYTSIDEAVKARDEMNARFLHGWAIFVDPAKPRESRPPPPRSEFASSGTGFRTNKSVGWNGPGSSVYN